MEKKQKSILVEIKIPMFFQYCPSGKTESDCPLRAHLEKNQTYTAVTFGGTVLYPKTKYWADARDAIDKMYSICAKCKENSK